MKSQSSLGPLNIGNVVTTGFSLFKSNFSTYFKLAGRGYLWVFVPVYGWAKFAMYQGLIARLAFGQLINQPETVTEARRSIQDRLWIFLVAGILEFLCLIGAYIAAVIVALIGGIILGVLAAALGLGPRVMMILGFVLGLVSALLAITWMSGRLFVTAMPIAVEANQVDASVALGNSWRLTKAATTRVMTIVFTAALVTFPLSLLINLGVQLPSVVLPEGSPLINLIVAISYALSIVVNMVTLPFWQCIKAATYYDLRARKEGLDIQLRDRPL